MNGLALDLVAERRTRDGASFRLQVALEADAGFTVVCGSSGAGKSTLLLAVLGALDDIRGLVTLDGRTLLDSTKGIALPLRERGLGMVFQDAPLFPHFDVLRNVAFGIRGPRRIARARELLERVGAADLAGRHPHELSGGQAQRAALARALGAQPRALLLDEPFSALDPISRRSLGELLIELQRSAGIPFVHVTHDLGEALRLGSRLVLLEAGGLVAVGAPAEVIALPATVAAARAVGTENLFSATVRGHDGREGCSEVTFDGTVVRTTLLDVAPGSQIELGLRAEDILLSLREIRDTSARNVLRGTIREVGMRGPTVELRVTTPASFRVIVTPASVRELGLEPGREVWLMIKAAAFHRLL